ncbi:MULTISPECIES: response regulator transcription factor [Desulfotignum]|jgi:two-component system alkaline phosphatase synthesis response regulator PhoP|uniref:Alkaline phosphatase synthesis transcriptional regulatory PhoP-like protein n=1 Tax=Desulfotignum phosphitoxidans DSM 13687 TaxID=1286635 RepID=S0G7T8_9BACT|nr:MULTISPECIES: response regulator [Desulfotignum]EMS81462.1 alkaline phosphatase synthesis transcriptional regulatory PhoP-like protein [Desulfotignum phosphitoxidans DSM 13687]
MGKQTVLIVDDEPDFVTMLKQDLHSEGYAVEVAYNGVEAIQKVKQSPPDIIVLDIMMPEKDGFAVCSELKNDDRYADIPIILLTAVSDHVSSSQYSHSQALDVEADDYLSKPASFEEILESIRSLLA